MRNTFLITGITLSALLCGTAFGADPRLLNLVMPDATTLAGANVTNTEITPFGQYLLTQLTATAGQELQTFITTTGFDPRQDVTEILAASSGNAANPGGIVLSIGTFPVQQITAAITARSPTLSVQTYGGATLITSGNPKSALSIAFLGTTIAIIGDTASVKAAIDRSAGVNSINPALAVQVQTLSTTEDAWAVTNSPAASLIPGLSATGGGATTAGFASQIGQLFSSIQGSSGGIKFGSTVVITGQAITNSASNATSLAGILQAVVSIASMAGGQDPQIAAFAQLLQGLKVTTEGTTINLALSIPETQLETLLNSLKNQSKPAAKTATIKPAALVN
jgi:hypothetical protein